jgi:hypothetical protein
LAVGSTVDDVVPSAVQVRSMRPRHASILVLGCHRVAKGA